MSAWSKFPNATYIDAVIASVKANPMKWDKAWEKAGGWTEARCAAWIEARDNVYDVERREAYDALRGVVQNTAWRAAGVTARRAAWNAALSLLVYDDCAHLLTTNPEHVKMMAEIGNEVAILLYPASLVFSEIKNERLV